MIRFQKAAAVAALCAMLLLLTEPAWAICIGCQRSGGRAAEPGAERQGLFGGRLFAGRAHRVSHREEARYEAGCGAASEASCGAAAAAVDVGSDAGSGYEVDDLTDMPPSPIDWRVTTVKLPDRPVRWRVTEVALAHNATAVMVAAR
jgi:hypothetical protein